MSHSLPPSAGAVTQIRLLVILPPGDSDDTPGSTTIRAQLEEAAPGAFSVTHVPSLEAARPLLGGHDVDAVLLAVPAGAGLAALDVVQEAAPTVPVIVWAQDSGSALAVDAVRHGAQDCLDCANTGGPELAHAIRLAVERQRMAAGMEYLAQKQAASERRFRSLITAVVDAVLVVDELGIVRFANPAAARLTGRGLGGMLGRPFGFPMPDGEPTEVVIYHPDGLRRVAELRAVAVEWVDQPAWLVSLRDVTEYIEMTQALAAERNLLRTLIDNLPDTIFVKDRQSRFLLANQSTARQVGAGRPADLLGKTDFDFHPPELAERFRADEQAIMDHDQPLIDHEEHVITSDGTQLWKLTTKIPLRNPDGEVIGLVGIGRDFTEQKAAQDAEREQRTLAEALYATTITINSALDLDTVMNQILGTVGQVVPHDAANIMLVEDGIGDVRFAYWRGYPPDIGEQFSAHRLSSEARYLRRMVESGKPVIVPDTAASADWGVLPQATWARSYAAAPIRAHGRVIGFLNLDSRTPGFFDQSHADKLQAFAAQAAIAIDNARLYEAVHSYALDMEQRVIERTAQLRRVTERVEAILNNSSDAITLTRVDGAIDQTNPAFDRQFGYAELDIIGQPLTLLAGTHSKEALAGALSALATTGQPQRIEIAARCQDGTEFDADVVLSPITCNDGEVAHIVVSLRDNSERKRMEEELRAALAKEKELGELKLRFVSMVSHEFRTPLATIQSSTGLLREYADRLSPERKAAHLGRIEGQIERLVVLLDDILTMSRMQSVGLDFKPGPLDLLALCQQVVDEVGLSAGPAIRLVFETSGDPVITEMDERLLRRVLTNLLSNAIKYSPEGGRVRLAVAFAPDEVTLWVEDEGIGIPADDRGHLFEPFFRADNVGTIQGTGLGLVITNQAVHLHGGQIKIDSAEGVGTTFTITLPIRQEKRDQT